MIDDETAILVIKKLAEQGFIITEEGVTKESMRINIKLSETNLYHLNQHHSYGKLYKESNSRILEAMVAGFFVSASKGEMFVPEEDIVSEFGNTIEQNYYEASESFLKFAKTYWSLRALIKHLRRDEDGLISFVGGRLLGVLEGEIGPLFFPFPGPKKVSPAVREDYQRAIIMKYAKFSKDIDIDIEDFINGNPILIRDRKAMDSSGRYLSFIYKIYNEWIGKAEKEEVIFKADNHAEQEEGEGVEKESKINRSWFVMNKTKKYILAVIVIITLMAWLGDGRMSLYYLISTFITFSLFTTIIIGLIALIRGKMPSMGIENRKGGAIVLVAGIVLQIIFEMFDFLMYIYFGLR